MSKREKNTMKGHKRQLYRCILRYTAEHDSDDPTRDIYWKLGKFEVDSTIVKHLKEEVYLYNQQIKALKNGNASICCYKNPEFKNETYSQANNGFKGAKYMDLYNVSFSVLFISDSEVDHHDVISRTRYKTLTRGSYETLKDILENPFDEYDIFSLGYCVLPQTKDLLLSVAS